MIKKRLSLFIALAFCAFLFLPQSQVHSKKLAQAQGGYVANQILIKLKSSAGSSVDGPQSGKGRVQLAQELFPQHGISAESLDSAEVEAQSSAFVISFAGDLSVEEAIARAQSDPRIEYAEPNRLLEPAETMPNDSLFNQQWSLFNNLTQGADIGATRAWDITQGNSDVVVAVTDTGIDITHPDLAANIWVNPAEIADNGIDEDSNGLVDDVNGWNFSDNNKNVYSDFLTDRHGTFVAGIIGAVGNNGIGVTGVAWNVKIMPVKFLGGANNTVAGAIKAINYVVTQKKRGINVRVINGSWGPSRPDCSTSFSQALKDAITSAGNKGILFVSSSGNGICGNNSFGDNLDVTPEYPAAWSGEIPTHISVTAIGRNDDLLFFSNYGQKTVGIAAPGDEFVYSTRAGSDYGTFFPGGTSFAAPHITGIAALLAAHEPALTPAQIKRRIIDTAEPIPSLAGKVEASGRANAYNALRNIPGNLPPLSFTEFAFTKKVIFLKGSGFVGGSMVVEANGVPVSGKVIYDDAFRLANGSYTEFSVKMGKAPIQEIFPLNVAVTVTLLNQATSVRSAPLLVTRINATQ
jgi:subtilisin family serine protease